MPSLNVCEHTPAKIEATKETTVSAFDATSITNSLPRGKHGGLICAETGVEVHRDYKPNDTGFLSYQKGLWFSSPFNYHLHSWKNHLAPYNTPAARLQYQNIFSKYIETKEKTTVGMTEWSL